MSQKILLIDAMSLAFRAFFSMPETMKAPDGTPINAVYGFVSLIMQAIEKTSPSHVVVCFDVKAPTFRHGLYPEYKGHRPSPPELFVAQIPVFRRILDELGIKWIDKPGFEADDLIGTLSEMADDVALKSVILTGDGDSLQLVSDHTSVMMTRKGVSDIVMFTPDLVRDTYGLSPKQLIDFKALKGDASDNIPGVKGVGEKTAKVLIETYQSLENLYDHLEEVKPDGVRQKLRDAQAMAVLSKRLVTIDVAINLGVSLDDYLFFPDWGRILGVFEGYAFKSLVKRYQKYLSESGQSSPPKSSPSIQAQLSPLYSSPSTGISYHSIGSLAELEAYLPELKSGFAIDLETTSLEIMDAQIVGVALCAKAGNAVYIPLNAYLKLQDTQGSLFDIPSSQPKDTMSCIRFKLNPYLEKLKPFLEDALIPKTTHNGKYEWAVLANYGIELSGIEFDTMIAAYLLFPGDRLGLKALASQLLGCDMVTYEDVTGTGKQKVSFDQVPISVATGYACADADMTWQLTEMLKVMITEKQLEPLLRDIELPTMKVLGKMERAGVKLDIPYLSTLETEFGAQKTILESHIYQSAGEHFNINSPKQLGDILYDKLQLPVLKKTKTGRSTDASVLEKLVNHHEIAQFLLQYRTVEKLLNTYVKALPELVHPITGKIHTHFNQTVAATGRLSSTHPNLQNIPIRTPEGGKLRRAFIPSRPENTLMSVDYSQIELRILAHLSRDPNMIEAFSRGEDIHKATASIIFETPLSEVTTSQRYQAKTVNFGIIYGQSAFGLSETLGIGRKEASEIISAYYLRFPTIKAVMDETIQFARDHGYVQTEFGRKRPVPDIKSSNMGLRQFSERMAVNTRMQGTAADLIKIAMIRIQAHIDQHHLKSRMIIQVHDELVFDVVASEKEALTDKVVSLMESAASFLVPLKVDVTYGNFLT